MNTGNQPMTRLIAMLLICVAVLGAVLAAYTWWTKTPDAPQGDATQDQKMQVLETLDTGARNQAELEAQLKVLRSLDTTSQPSRGEDAAARPAAEVEAENSEKMKILQGLDAQ